MIELFTNPGYLAAGGALVSSPIIIHLINRMRFKRLKWAAMEFLLKSQKRNRRRLIIEQLILLALRCLLVVLTALLVLRFVGLSMAGFYEKEALHVIIVDDTLSMTDRWKEGNDEKNCFKVARDEVILKQIYKNIAQSTTNERLAIVPLSALVLDPEFQPTIYSKLGEKATEIEITKALEQMQPSHLHVPLVRGVKYATKLMGESEHATRRHVVHIVSDFRSRDWTATDSQELHKALLQLDQNKVAVWMRDCAYPYRVKDQGGVPRSNDNLALVDFRAGTKVVGKGMPVTFSVTVANFSPRDEQVTLIVFDDETGKEFLDIDFNTTMPLKVPANGTAVASFEKRFYELPASKKFHAQKISARLENAVRQPLQDGLEGDNTRYASVEVREKVPVLVIDGLRPRGRQENKDSFFIETAIISVPGTSYEIKYADELVPGGAGVKILEQSDLSQYPSIYLLNVRELTKKQRDNLESYVKEGGGVGFFLGSEVNGGYYTKELYRNGAGVFPIPIREGYHPPGAQDPLKPKFTGSPQLLLRDDLVNGMENLPVFGPIFRDPKQQAFLKDLPIKRYFPAIRQGWNPEPGRVMELATLPNENSARAYQETALRLLDKLPLDKPEFKQYTRGLKRHIDAVRFVIAPGSDARAYDLARALDGMLSDPGEKDDKGYRLDRPNLTEFFGIPENKNLKDEITDLKNSVMYGDAMVVAQRFGKGKVVAVLTTAGKDWNDWGGGSDAAFLFQPFVWEMQNYLSSQGVEANLTVGTPIKVDVDVNKHKKEGGAGKLFTVRSFHKAQHNKAVQIKPEQRNFGQESKDGVQSFAYEKTTEPGFYLTELFNTDDDKTALAGWGHVYNVDAITEGKLQRVSQEQLEQLVLRPATGGHIKTIDGPTGDQKGIVNKQTDMSESPWFFLLFLLILVSEQALAVHLSFHLRNNEAALPGAAVSSQAQAA